MLTKSDQRPDATDKTSDTISVGLTTEFGHNPWCDEPSTNDGLADGSFCTAPTIPSRFSIDSPARTVGNIVNDNGVSRPRGYSTVHELTSVDTQPQTFNDDGSLPLSNRGLELTWGDDGRLTQTVAPPLLANLYGNGVTEDLETDYGYNTLNQRVWVHARESGVTRSHRLFIYAGSNCIAEYNIGAAADSPANEYVYANSIDSLVLIRRGNSQRLIPIRNQQWSVTALIDADTGGVLERYAYDVFGERIILAPDATSIRQKSWYENQYGYTSRRHDAESGSMYFRARFFDPSTGEFTSQDPNGAEAVDSLHAAVLDIGANPSNYSMGCIQGAAIVMQLGIANSVSKEEFDGGLGNSLIGWKNEAAFRRGLTNYVVARFDEPWILGDWGFIANTGWDETRDPQGIEIGENLIYLGKGNFWGHSPNADRVKTGREWWETVQSWDGAAQESARRWHPRIGLK